MPSCPKCGKEVDKGMNFCPHCGLRLAEDKELLKLKVEELRHEERSSLLTGALGYFLLALGAWLMVGITATRIEWRGLIPYEVTYHPYAGLGAIILLFAILLIVTGFGYAAYCWYKRSKLLKQLESLR